MMKINLLKNLMKLLKMKLLKMKLIINRIQQKIKIQILLTLNLQEEKIKMIYNILKMNLNNINYSKI